jgi:hypothetical protein
MTTTQFRFKPAFVAKAGVLAAVAALSVQAGESKAQQAPGDSISCLVSAVVGGTCNGASMTIGDKSLTGLTFTDFTPGALDSILFTQITPVFYQLQYNFDPQAQSNITGTFGYTISITPAGVVAGNKFKAAQANITGGNLLGGAFTTTLNSSTLPGPLIANSLSNPSPAGFFNPNTLAATFTQTFAASAPSGQGPATINSFGIQFTQTKPSTDTSVPGPLPILGAGAAFGLSRKLRNRIKQVA